MPSGVGEKQQEETSSPWVCGGEGPWLGDLEEGGVGEAETWVVMATRGRGSLPHAAFSWS